MLLKYKDGNGNWVTAPVVTKIEKTGGLTAEDLTFSGMCDYALQNNIGAALVNKYSNLISFKDVFSAQQLFKNNDADLDSLTINIKDCLINTFPGGYRGKKLPRVIGTLKSNSSTVQAFLSGCEFIREIPEYFYDGIDFSGVSDAGFGMYFFCNNCRCLRTAPNGLINKITPSNGKAIYAGYAYVFTYCASLDELNNYLVNNRATYTANCFTNFCYQCGRLKNFTFKKNEDNTPIVVMWKNQTIDFSNNLGWSPGKTDIYNSGITADKEVKDDATYQALKNDPDWFTCDINYSRYNHDSAVATINSLPDTSAYLATEGGTNTIKFLGQAGASTDGGAINTLTEEEIAVAAAKGWTVTLV